MRKAALLLALSFSMSAFAAGVVGKWNAVAKTPDGDEIKAELTLKEEGGKLTGAMVLPEGTVPLEEVEFKENVLSYKLEYNGMGVTVKMTLDGDKLRGNYTTQNGETGPIEADRTVESVVASESPLAGDWKVSTKAPDGTPLKMVFSLKLNDGKWSGELVAEEYGMTLSLADIKVDGASLTCNVPTDQGTYAVVAKVANEKLEGTSTGPDGTKHKITGNR